MAKQQAVAKKESAGELALNDYGEYAGQGFENTDSQDFSIPFLTLFQALTPRVAEGNAVAGQLFNTVTEEVFEGDQGIVFVPAHREHVFVEWVPREKGGGFVARYELNNPVVAKAKADAAQVNQLKTEAGNDLIETFYIYGLRALEGGGFEPLVVSFTSTKISVYRRFMTKVNQFMVPTADGGKRPAPLFAHRVRITSVDQKSKKGMFKNYQITPEVDGDISKSLNKVDSELFQAGITLRKMVATGAATAAYDSEANVQGGSSETEEVPF